MQVTLGPESVRQSRAGLRSLVLKLQHDALSIHDVLLRCPGECEIVPCSHYWQHKS